MSYASWKLIEKGTQRVFLAKKAKNCEENDQYYS